MSRPPSKVMQRIATPQVVSWPLLWISTAVLLADDVRQVVISGVSVQEWPGALWPAIAGTLLGQAIAFTVLLLARASWLRTARAQRHPMATVWTFILASLLAQIAVGFVPMREAAPGLDRILVQAATLTIIALIVMAVREHRQTMSALGSTRAALLVAADEGRRRLEYQRNEVTDQVDAVIAQTIAALEQGGEDLPATLVHASDETLRPLSHELARPEEPFVVEAPESPQPRWRVVLAEVAGRPLIAPLLTALVMTVVVTRLTITDVSGAEPDVAVDVGAGTVGAQVDLQSFAISLAGLALVFVATYAAAWLVRRVTRRLLPSRMPSQRWLIVIVSIIPIALAAELSVIALYVMAGREALPPITPLTLAQFLIPIAAVTFLVAVIRTVSVAQEDMREQIERGNEELAWQIARINNELWSERQRLSLAVHGPIRAALTAGAIELTRAEEQRVSDQERCAITEDTRERLTAARATLAVAPTPPDVATALDEMRRVWRGVCRIDSAISEEARDRLAADPHAAEAVVAVAGEAIGNAVNHAHAGAIAVVVGLDDRSLELTVTNDGHGPDGEAGPGLGSRMLDDLTTEWSLTHTGGQTTLRARIPAG